MIFKLFKDRKVAPKVRAKRYLKMVDNMESIVDLHSLSYFGKDGDFRYPKIKIILDIGVEAVLAYRTIDQRNYDYTNLVKSIDEINKLDLEKNEI